MKCPICGGQVWREIYSGSIRVGKEDSTEGKVLECEDCCVQRLEHFYDKCKYETGEYRQELHEAEWDYELHDSRAIHFLSELPTMRNKVVIDVGCGNGSFLDMISGMASKVIAVEPNCQYRNMPYDTYSYANEVQELADIVVSFDVIEHTENPVDFMLELKRLLKPDGRLFVATPNREEILFRLLPGYKKFRYQAVHNWYFNRDSLWNCASEADLKIVDLRTIHRFGIGNTFGWLTKNGPVGDLSYPFLEGQIDDLWRSYLNRENLGEILLIECRRREHEESSDSGL